MIFSHLVHSRFLNQFPKLAGQSYIQEFERKEHEIFAIFSQSKD
jgi:hypothetical protein